MYREYGPPTRALAEFVECFWQRTLLDPCLDLIGAVLPDGRVDLLWSANGQMIVAGPATRWLPRALTPPFAVVGVRFHPGVGPALLGLPAHKLVDSYVPLASLDSRSAGALRAGLVTAENAGQAASAMTEGISRLGGAVAIDPLVRAAVGELDQPGTRVGTLAQRLGISERQLQRRFRDAVGYGPKALQRILRFQRALVEIRRGREQSGGLARVAAATGYADQAHLTRESRRLAGFGPKRLERNELSSPLALQAPVGPQHRKGPDRTVPAPLQARLRRVAREIDLPTSV